MGWVKPNHIRKANASKITAQGKRKKGKPQLARDGLSATQAAHIEMVEKSPAQKVSKGTWTRLSSRPKTSGSNSDGMRPKDPKRKTCDHPDWEVLMMEREKKVKLEDETKQLNLLLATHMG